MKSLLPLLIALSLFTGCKKETEEKGGDYYGPAAPRMEQEAWEQHSEV